MSKILKNAKPHEVRMREGSPNAQRKAVKSKDSVEKTSERPASRSVKVRMETPAPADPIVPSSIAKKSRARIKPAVQDSPARVDSSSKPTATVPLSVPRAPVPEHELWEQDSPVMRRISTLRARNAQLSEQIQRIKTPA